ncbi:NAD-dependent epimerase/dehydratase family protein [Paludibaculum fermentans]|uniref:NAD-dependent epimerase/dehydratase family protein n=1 Tax=Paludibaculum fermentans TaxID=1473598 RepID=UPI003EBA60C1
MRIAVIGGSGHIGTFLTPQLVEAGHDVLCVSRGLREPYQPHDAWAAVRNVVLDRTAEEAAGSFGSRILELKAEVVIDLTCYTLDSARQLVGALIGHVGHYLHCGTIWIHGHSVEVPTTEDQPRKPISEYGRQKAAIEEYLQGAHRDYGFPATLLHPGHLVGCGWLPLNPAANFNFEVFEKLSQGRELALPNFGLETVHHVHAGDVAQAFANAVERRAASTGESFHVVSPAAMTLRGYAERVAGWFGQEAKLTFLPWSEWRHTVAQKDAEMTWDHIARSPNCSIAKAERLLDYRPRYRSDAAVRESLLWWLAR